MRFVAVCDVKAVRREAVKKMADAKYGNQDCATYRDLRELLARSDIDAVLIATGPNWHATAAILAAKAGKDVYCEKPCTKNIAQSLALAETFRRTARVFQAGTQRRNLPHFAFAVELARRGKLGKLQTVHAHPAGMATGSSGWAAAEPEPPKEEIDWDLYLGPAAWRPFNRGTAGRLQLREGRRHGRRRRAGMGLALRRPLPVGQRCRSTRPRSSTTRPRKAGSSPATPTASSWSSATTAGCRWAPARCGSRARPAGSRRATAASSSLSSPALLAGRKVAEIGGYPATFHIRDFLNCVKSRGQPRANADVACHSHIACHAANIAIFLNRKLAYDPQKNEFIGDDEANRLRSEALREPWRL